MSMTSGTKLRKSNYRILREFSLQYNIAIRYICQSSRSVSTIDNNDNIQSHLLIHLILPQLIITNVMKGNYKMFNLYNKFTFLLIYSQVFF